MIKTQKELKQVMKMIRSLVTTTYHSDGRLVAGALMELEETARAHIKHKCPPCQRSHEMAEGFSGGL